MVERPKVIITGCLGSLGHALSTRLLEEDCHVTGIDLPSAHRRKSPKGVKVYRLDIGNSDDKTQVALHDLVANHDGIIHLAGISRVGMARANPLLTIQTNILGTANLLEAIRVVPKQPWLIFASSVEVKVTMRGEFSFSNMYGLTKSVSELLARRYSIDYGLRSAAARISGIYGDVEDYQDKVPLVLIRAAVQGEPLRIASSSRLMDYVHVEAVCNMLMEAISRMGKSEAGTFAVFDIKSGNRFTLANLARRIKRIAKSDSAIVMFEQPKDSEKPVVWWDIPYSGPDLNAGLKLLLAKLRL